MGMCVFDWEAIAAWVQALGAIAAIWYTVWHGQNILRREQERQRCDLSERRTISTHSYIAQIERFVSAVRLKRNKICAISESKNYDVIFEWPEHELVSMFSLPEVGALFDQLENIALLDPQLASQFVAYLGRVNNVERDLTPISIAYRHTAAPVRYLEDLFISGENTYGGLITEGERIIQTLRAAIEPNISINRTAAPKVV